MRKRFLISFILPVLLAPLMLFSACGGFSYSDICDFIRDNGELNLSAGAYGLAYRDNDCGLAAWCKIDGGETYFALRISSGRQSESLMLIANGIGSDYAIGYTVTNENGDIVCEASGFVVAESLELRKMDFTLAGSDVGKRINELILLLLVGIDRYIFGDSGIKMSDLGFRY